MDLSQIVPNIVKIWQQYWQVFLLEGVMNTLKLTAIAVLFGVILGTLVAMAKMCRFKVRAYRPWTRARPKRPEALASPGGRL